MYTIHVHTMVCWFCYGCLCMYSMQRVEIFHQRIEEEKQKLGITRDPSHHPPATYITIHRERILEDGYVQLSLLSATTLKGTIRVKFVNVQVLTYACLHIHPSIRLCICTYLYVLMSELSTTIMLRSVEHVIWTLWCCVMLYDYSGP